MPLRPPHSPAPSYGMSTVCICGRRRRHSPSLNTARRNDKVWIWRLFLVIFVERAATCPLPAEPSVSPSQDRLKMNKTQLIESISSEAGISRGEAKRSLEAFMKITTAALISGEKSHPGRIRHLRNREETCTNRTGPAQRSPYPDSGQKRRQVSPRHRTQ